MMEWPGWKKSDISLKVGDVLTVNGFRNYRKRHWWEFWQPRWIDLGERPPLRGVVIAEYSADDAALLSPEDVGRG